MFSEKAHQNLSTATIKKDTNTCFIPLQAIDVRLPEKFNFPFSYEPHPLALIAAEDLQKRIQNELACLHPFGSETEPGIGKMFGVLVVEDENNNLGYLAAFSGKIGDSNFYPGFVPPVFDTLDPDGFYKQEEAETNIINRKIEQLEAAESFKSAFDKLETKRAEAATAIQELKEEIKRQKKLRKQLRVDALATHSPESYRRLDEHLNTESIKWHYSLKETKRKWDDIVAAYEKEAQKYLNEVNDLKSLRKVKSAELQRRLFENYNFLNQYGDAKNLIEIFQITDDLTPPSGAGECAAPKLLQYAWTHGMRPVTMAEFWWGKSPSSEVRKHGYFYPACTGKCKPILVHMLKDVPMEDNPMLINPALGKELPIIWEDDYMLVVNKPAEFLSVPGKTITDSVLTRVKTLYPDASGPLLVHRLDMSTSGLLLIAKYKEIHQHLQAQFIKRRVKKRYVAILKGNFRCKERSGIIDLPLRVDLDDRPRQVVCFDHGKPAQTYWELKHSEGDEHRVYFYPLTGRTHQLRVHAAHPLGLTVPIKGDDLYGIRYDRLYLHAELLEFTHPITRKTITLVAEPEF